LPLEFNDGMYYLINGLFFLFSLLPWRFLYFLSDLFSFIFIHIIRYRREIILHNLQIAFPELSDEKRWEIAKKFYKNFVDNFIETIKLRFISKKELSKRFIYNHDILLQPAKAGRNLTIALCHSFNWEYANLGLSANFPYTFICVYMPIKNKSLERVFIKMRNHLGSKLVRATQFRKDFLPYHKQIFAIGLVSDQNPGDPGTAYWLPFFGKMTPFVKGPEKNAISNNAYVVYCHLKKVKRGYYSCNLEIITKAPKELAPGEITKMIVSRMEKTIREQPENYLWSHRRWKWDFSEEKYGASKILRN